MTHTKSYAKLIDTVRETGGDVDTMTAFAECVITAYQAAQPAPAVQEPVAWVYKGDAEFDGKEWRDSIRVTTSKQVADWQGKDIQPLYTTPPAQPAPTVQELHKENLYYPATYIGEGWQDGFDGKDKASTLEPYLSGYAEGKADARSIEAAHGITKGQP